MFGCREIKILLNKAVADNVYVQGREENSSKPAVSSGILEFIPVFFFCCLIFFERKAGLLRVGTVVLAG